MIENGFCVHQKPGSAEGAGGETPSEPYVAMCDAHANQAMETPAGAVCDVICDLVSIDVATEQL